MINITNPQADSHVGNTKCELKPNCIPHLVIMICFTLKIKSSSLKLYNVLVGFTGAQNKQFTTRPRSSKKTRKKYSITLRCLVKHRANQHGQSEHYHYLVFGGRGLKSPTSQMILRRRGCVRLSRSSFWWTGPYNSVIIYCYPSFSFHFFF